MNCVVFSPEDDGWRRALDECPHDFYHLPKYVALEAERVGGDAACVVFREGDSLAVVPLVVRSLPADLLGVAPDYLDATSPYGYPGPVFGGPLPVDEGFVARSFEALVEVMRARKIVSAFLRLHPLVGLPRTESGSDAIETMEHGETVWLDLSRGIEELTRDTRPTHRNLIARARREGFVVAKDESDAALLEFGDIYRETMRRIGASAMYLFSDDYFFALREALGPVFHLWTVSLGDEVAAAGLFPACQGLVQYHLSGTREKFARQSPTRLLLAEVRNWAVSAGCSVLHLGGGLGSREDGLFRFKAGFSGSRARFRTMRIIADRELYGRLVESVAVGGAAVPDEGFFPRYRAPR